MRMRDILFLLPAVLLTACPTGTDDDDDDTSDLPIIDHEPVTSAVEATDVAIAATVTPPPESEDDLPLVVTLNFRASEGSWEVAPMEAAEGSDDFAATIPAASVMVGGVDYYLSAQWGDSVATDPADAPDLPHEIVVEAAPLNEPAPVRARYEAASDSVIVTWTPPVSSAFTGYSVTAELDDGSEPVPVCQAADLEGTCTVAADGVWNTDYATWTVTLAADAQGGTSSDVRTDSLHLLLDRFGKEPTKLDPTTFGTGELEFFLPSGVAVQGSTVHVAEQSNHRLQSFSDSGDFLGFVAAAGPPGTPGIGDAEFNSPFDVTVSEDGALYVADHTNARVQILDATTRQFEGAFGTLGEGEGQLRFPVSVALDGGGLLHVVESVNARVSVFDGEGVFIESYSAVESELVIPTRAAWLPDLGAMAISDGSLIHVSGADADSTWDLELSGTAVASGLCAVGWGETIVTIDDPAGTAGSDGHRLVRVDEAGEIITSFGEWGVAGGQFWRPVDCDVDGDGNVWVADALNHRIQVFGP